MQRSYPFKHFNFKIGRWVYLYNLLNQKSQVLRVFLKINKKSPRKKQQQDSWCLETTAGPGWVWGQSAPGYFWASSCCGRNFSSAQGQGGEAALRQESHSCSTPLARLTAFSLTCCDVFISANGYLGSMILNHAETNILIQRSLYTYVGISTD